MKIHVLVVDAASVIMMSGHSILEEMATIKQDVFDHLMKPFDKTALLSIAHQCLQVQQLTANLRYSGN